MKLRLLFTLLAAVIFNSCIVEKEFLEPERFVPLVHDVGLFVNYADHVTVKTNDDNFITVGSTTDGYFLYKSIEVRKHSAAGEDIWTSTTYSITHDRYRDLCQDLDGNTYVTGWVQENITNGVYIRKIDAQGSEVWSRSYYINSIHYTPERIVANANGEIFLAAYNATSGQNRHYLAKISTSGVLLWNKEIYSDMDSKEIALMPDGGCVIAATNDANSLTKLFRYDSDGNMLKATDLPISFLNYANDLKVDQSGNIYVKCNEYPRSSNNNSADELIIFKYSSELDKLWEYKYVNNDFNIFFGSITLDTENNTFVALNKYGTYQYVPLIIKLNENGMEEWQFVSSSLESYIVPYHISLIDNEEKLNIMLGMNDHPVSQFQIKTDGTIINE